MAALKSGQTGLTARYAEALFELAEQQGQLDAVQHSLIELQKAIQESIDLRRVLGSPLLDRNEQANALDALLQRMNAAPVVRNFVQVVVHNRRLFALPAMIQDFLQRLAEKRGEVTAEIRVAQDLSEAQRSRLLEVLGRRLGGQIRLHIQRDDSLIGGMVVRIGSRMIDNSLKTKLQKLQLTMKGIG